MANNQQQPPPADFGMNDRSVVAHRDSKAKRITREEVTTLKMKVVSSEKRMKPIGYSLGKMLRSLVYYCTFTAAKPRSQCKEAGGCILPVGVKYGSGQDLICGECGKKIATPEQLRKAIPPMAAVPSNAPSR